MAPRPRTSESRARWGPALVAGLVAASFVLLPAGPAPSSLSAQQVPPSERVPAPAPEDVATIDAAVAAIYAAISGPAGEPRDWDRFRSVMHPDARLIPTGPTPAGGRAANFWTVEEYIERAGPQLEAGGFFENEIGRRTDRYGGVVHLMSAYESLRTADGEPFARGVNSFQLFWDGSRWWVMNIFWEQETPENPIPADLIGAGNSDGP